MERKNIIQAVIACVVGLLIYALCVAIDLFGFAKYFAQCDNGYTVWQYNPGAFSSYIYEIRTGIIRVDSGLRFREIKDFLDENNCIILGGG